MLKTLLTFLILLSLIKISYAQNKSDKIVFVVDSIYVQNDPEEGDNINQTDVSDLKVIKNKDSLKALGLEKFDGVTYIFTKAYRERSEQQKQIPSTKQMIKNNGVFELNGNTYNGKFIDYYYSGKKKSEGTLKNGVIDGDIIMYYQNGKIKIKRHYHPGGVKDGKEVLYFEDGTPMQQGAYVNGKEDGVWESYFPNGQIKMRTNYKNGELVDTGAIYYSTGKLKQKVLMKKGKAVSDPIHEKIDNLIAKSKDSNEEGDMKSAIKYCSKAIELDSSYADAYFYIGTMKLNDLKFDDAITDFNKALELEPFMDRALANRAVARVRKYQFSNSRTISKNSQVTVLASKDKVPLPEEEREKICSDLQKVVSLGIKLGLIQEMIKDYCTGNSNN